LNQPVQYNAMKVKFVAQTTGASCSFQGQGVFVKLCCLLICKDNSKSYRITM